MLGKQSAKCLSLVALAALALASLTAANAYDRADYRQGEIIHEWAGHGVWELELISGGQTGDDKCVIGASVGAHTPTLILVFIFDGGAFSHGKDLNFSDGGMMQVFFMDTNFAAINDKNYKEALNFEGRSEVRMSADNWEFLNKNIIRQVLTSRGMEWTAPDGPLFVAWDMPNPEDGLKTPTIDILNRMRAGKELIIRSWMMTHHIPLTGFGDVLDEFSECTDMQQDGTQ